MLSEYEGFLLWIWITSLGRPQRDIIKALYSIYKDENSIMTAAVKRDVEQEFKASFPKAAERFEDKATLERSKNILDKAMNLGMNICTFGMDSYPTILREIHSPPTILYYYGVLPEDYRHDIRMISIVGSRACTAYGRQCARNIASELALAGVGVVSGMARGIDGEAHCGAISSKGYTVAVLAGGADNVYPPEHKKLYDMIREYGCVMSEQIPCSPPDKRFFPARNRIIAGLSEGTLLVEARSSSGAMITIDQALNESRNIYAVPGNINSPLSLGCNNIIKTGGICVTSAADILEDMGYEAADTNISNNGVIDSLPKLQRETVGAVRIGCHDVNEIAAHLCCGAGAVSGALTMLEIKGILHQLPDGSYEICGIYANI